MLATIAIILIVLWLAGLLVFKTAGALIHILLVIGIIMLVLHFVRSRTLHEQHDQSREDCDRDPVVRCFHVTPSKPMLGGMVESAML